MKKLIIGVMSLGMVACQQAAPPVAKRGAKMRPTAILIKEPTPGAKPDGPLPSANLRISDTLTVPMRSLLKEYDLARLWSSEDSTNEVSPIQQLDGFFGPDRYRIAFVIASARRDGLDPSLFHVTGKNRYKKRVSSFIGIIRVRVVQDLKVEYLDLAPEDSLAQAYTAKAQFRFQEDSTQSGAGTFEGTGVLDFYITPRGEIGQVMFVDGLHYPARGQGILFKGHWTNRQIGPKKELLLARDIFRIAPDVLEKFGIGERAAEINPKYAKLGWNELWENDEWWAETPKPSLNL